VLDPDLVPPKGSIVGPPVVSNAQPNSRIGPMSRELLEPALLAGSIDDLTFDANGAA